MIYDHILIRYGELALKKTNRKQFIRRIIMHIKNALKAFPNLTYQNKGLRFYIILNGEDAESIIPILKKIPGIYSFSLVARCESNIEDIKELALRVLEETLKTKNGTIKVETNRGDKNFPLTSLEVSKQVARHLFINIPNLKADVHHPDIRIDIDLRLEGTFIFTDEILGLGGMPAGSLGKGMLMISGGLDSVVAGYLSMKRGIDIEAIHFASPPYTSELALQKVIDLLECLTDYSLSGQIKLHVIPFTKIQKAIYDNAREDYCITIMRRMMYRLSENVAKQMKALAIINGENVGQVASQTLESMTTIGETIKMPVLRPLVVFDKADIVKIAQEIDTFDISIRPYEDCCTVFVPRHPQIKPSAKVAKTEEEKFDYQNLLQEALDNRQTIVLRKGEHYDIFEKGE